MFKSLALLGTLALALAPALEGCATGANGDLVVGGFDIGAKASVTVATIETDAQALEAAVPLICAKIAAGTALGQSELAIAQSVMKVPPKTVAGPNTFSSQIAGDCALAQSAVALVAPAKKVSK